MSQLMRLKRVMEVTGLCRTAVYQTEGFPKPIKIGAVSRAGSVAWVASEVEEWINARIADSRGAEVAR